MVNRDLLQTYRDLLNLREHDLDRLYAEHQAVFLLLRLLLEGGFYAAALAVIRRRLS